MPSGVSFTEVHLASMTHWSRHSSLRDLLTRAVVVVEKTPLVLGPTIGIHGDFLMCFKKQAPHKSISMTPS